MKLPGAGPYRLPDGGLIDRRTTIPFIFNGRAYAGHDGDSLASALLANGVRVVARSLKFHRPRGVFSCGVEEPAALIQVGEGAQAVPSERAPLVALRAGLQARSQAGWPSVDFDLGRALDALSALWAAGFYNKAFKWPSWHVYEPFIRRVAGLGRAPQEPDPDRYEVRNLHCDVLVIGSGVAGLEAALAAGRSGSRVVLVEQDHQLGGASIWKGTTPERAIEELKLLPDVRVLSRTTAVGYYDHNVVALLERIESAREAGTPRERYWIVRTKRVVLATGVIEQPLIFDHNDRPGIMLAGAAHQYLRRYGIAPGVRPLIATNNDSAYALAKNLKEAGVDVVGVADTRHEAAPTLRSEMQELGIEVFAGWMPIDTAGFSALRRVTLGQLSPDGSRIVSTRTFACDALAVSGGFCPALQLFAQAGGKLAYDDESGALRPITSHPDIEIVGSAAERVAIGPRVSPVGNPRRQWVDLLQDVTVSDLQLALRENFISVEHVKRHTTIGMGADQGKTSAALALNVLGKLRGLSPGTFGHTTLRPPLTPVTLGAIAGRETGERFAPYRRLPLDDWHVAHGAILHEFGGWRRPVAYPRAGESREQATHREALAVRTAAGLFDGSPLGKIEIHGPDALTFLDRFYINDLIALKPWRARYGLMLRESGVLFDDGTVVMLAPDRFVITTTSGNAGRVFQWLEEWRQCEWPQLRVAILPVTEQWATISLAGPQARAILGKLPVDVDLSAQAFPHMAVREARVFGAPARIYRVSFTGELTYEINVPCSRAQQLWAALLEAGAPLGLQPVGIDAIMLLRLEKGFLHIGTDTDGTTVPDDIGWGRVAAQKKADYIGKRSLRLPENMRPDRLQLIGLQGERGRPFIVGSHLRLSTSVEVTDGWITSAGVSVVTQEPIALALLRNGRAHVGGEVAVYDAGAEIGRARIVNPPFVDPAGERMNA
jgi:sarcosine oxidase subunit alpha